MTEATGFILRIVFTVSLYAFVVVTFLVLRRQLRHSSSFHGPDGVGIQPVASRLILEVCGPADGPIGRVLDLEREIVIGRRSPCDVLVLDDAVSSQHAQFVPAPGGGWLVVDLGSTNGTTVNDSRIGAPARLATGDLVRFGAMVWRYVDPSAPVEGRTR
ncbi:MAG: FHA domain-containing protein [Chloroflexi bacterium]|nr:FHA domain-containing protein [Chloroflexota bacterium]